MMPPVLMVLTTRGATTAQRLLGIWPNAEIHARKGRIVGAHGYFTHSKDFLRALFSRGHPIIAFCAAGIVIRALGPVLCDKKKEPPVLAVSESGDRIVPLLGGHRGAHALAQEIADHLGGWIASTGGGENRFGVLLDAPPSDYRLANPSDYPAFIAELLQQESVTLDCPDEECGLDWLMQSRLPWRDDADLSIHVGIGIQAGDSRRLVYHPQVLLLGVGCERGAEPEEVVDLVQRTLQQSRLAQKAIAALVTLDLKANEPALLYLEGLLGIPLRLFSAEQLEMETPRLANPSDVVFKQVGCHGVAEAAALAAGGRDSKLLVAKTKSARATCAVVRAKQRVDLERIGRRPGSLSVIGLGPGDTGQRSLEADRALAKASDVVGYRLYLQLLGTLARGKTLHGFELGEEKERAIKALELAVQGREVALVSSGDAGIYGMASPLFEEMRKQEDLFRTFSLRVIPGISAQQAAAAISGAPLGHDFVTISLSDLLTPWDQIEMRLKIALEGDFVLALYNPVSKRRKQRFRRALELLLSHRDASTPVVVAQNLGREGERVRILALDDLNANEINMKTILLVGSSQTCRFGEWVYTPRGYENSGEER